MKTRKRGRKIAIEVEKEKESNKVEGKKGKNARQMEEKVMERK